MGASESVNPIPYYPHGSRYKFRYAITAKSIRAKGNSHYVQFHSKKKNNQQQRSNLSQYDDDSGQQRVNDRQQVVVIMEAPGQGSGNIDSQTLNLDGEEEGGETPPVQTRCGQSCFWFWILYGLILSGVVSCNMHGLSLLFWFLDYGSLGHLIAQMVHLLLMHISYSVFMIVGAAEVKHCVRVVLLLVLLVLRLGGNLLNITHEVWRKRGTDEQYLIWWIGFAVVDTAYWSYLLIQTIRNGGNRIICRISLPYIVKILLIGSASSGISVIINYIWNCRGEGEIDPTPAHAAILAVIVGQMEHRARPWCTGGAINCLKCFCSHLPYAFMGLSGIVLIGEWTAFKLLPIVQDKCGNLYRWSMAAQIATLFGTALHYLTVISILEYNRIRNVGLLGDEPDESARERKEKRDIFEP